MDLFDPPSPEKKIIAPAEQAEVVPCSSPLAGNKLRPDNVCRVGGGHGSFSDNFGRSWFCLAHAPTGFFATGKT